MKITEHPPTWRFLVITLSTWANFLSYQSFALSAPSELIFVWIFARLLQPQERRRPCYLDLPPAPWQTKKSAELGRNDGKNDGKIGSAWKFTQSLVMVDWLNEWWLFPLCSQPLDNYVQLPNMFRGCIMFHHLQNGKAGGLWMISLHCIYNWTGGLASSYGKLRKDRFEARW